MLKHIMYIQLMSVLCIHKELSFITFPNIEAHILCLTTHGCEIFKASFSLSTSGDNEWQHSLHSVATLLLHRPRQYSKM